MKRVLAVAAVIALTACGGTTKSAGTTASSSASTADHTAVLADHETVDLVAQLTPVAGYRYVDVPADETRNALDRLHQVEQDTGASGFFAGVSLHGIVADDPAQNLSGTRSGRPEVGMLQLYAYQVAPPYGTESSPAFFARTRR